MTVGHAMCVATLVATCVLSASCAAPKQDSTVLTQDSTALKQDSTVLTQDSTVLKQDSTAPKQDTWEPAAVGAATFVVNRGTRGMSSQLRWVLSPDSAAIVVIDDPVGVEAEPVPDAVFYATERTGRTWRMDSVWSAAPSPDWRYLAVGRAVVIGGEREQRVPASAWNAPARRLRELVGDTAGAERALSGDSLRAHSYAVSGMSVMEGAAATLLIDVNALPTATARFVSLDGWRVSWSDDGRSILIGERPVRAGDDEPASTTRRAGIAAGAAASNAGPAELRWTEGPTTTIGEQAPTASRALVVRGRTIESRAGRVLLRETDGAGRIVEREVGPGVPLAATRGGHFILALVPRAGAPSHESSEQAVVYRVP